MLSFNPNPLYFRYSRTDESRMWNCDEMDRKSPTAWPSITSTGRREKLRSPNSSNPNKIYPERDAPTLKPPINPGPAGKYAVFFRSFHSTSLSVPLTLRSITRLQDEGEGQHFGSWFNSSRRVCTTRRRAVCERKVSNWLQQKSDFSFSSRSVSAFPGPEQTSSLSNLCARG